MTFYRIKETVNKKTGKVYRYIFEQWCYRDSAGKIHNKSRSLGKDTTELRAKLGITNKQVDQAAAARMISSKISKQPGKKKTKSKKISKK